jgi:hypothetical protein
MSHALTAGKWIEGRADGPKGRGMKDGETGMQQTSHSLCLMQTGKNGTIPSFLQSAISIVLALTLLEFNLKGLRYS